MLYAWRFCVCRAPQPPPPMRDKRRSCASTLPPNRSTRTPCSSSAWATSTNFFTRMPNSPPASCRSPSQRAIASAVPMCGVPYHAAEGYICRLLQKGYRIAICEQMEDPKLTKKIVRREVTRVLPPGQPSIRHSARNENNYLAATQRSHACRGPGRSRAARSLHRRLLAPPNSPAQIRCRLALDELASQHPAKCSLPQARSPFDAHGKNGAALDRIAAKPAWKPGPSARLRPPAAGTANGTLARWLRPRRPHRSRRRRRRRPALCAHPLSQAIYRTSTGCAITSAPSTWSSIRSPCATSNWSSRSSAKSPPATLFHTLDCCQTPMGKRLLRANLLRPLLDAAEIEARYDAVAEPQTALQPREELR